MRILFLLAVAAIAATLTCKAVPVSSTIHPKKIIIVVVNAEGQAIMGRDTLTMEDMTKELRQRIWKSYMGTGNMPDSVALQFTGEVLMGVRGSAMDAVKKAQEEALTELCLQKYKTTFDQLNSNKQAKLKRQFPVLFQQTF